MPTAIVADASPLIALYDGGCLQILKIAFDEVIIPERVHKEVFANSRNRAKPKWIKIRAITKAETIYRFSQLNEQMDRGESEAIALAEELGLEVLLDERRARAICRDLQIAHKSAFEVCILLRRANQITAKQMASVEQALRFHNAFVPGPDDEITIPY